jgi:exonuclease III
LNNPARWQVVKDLIVENSCNIICSQETKLQAVDDLIIASTLEQQFCGNYVVLPFEGTRGGIILACSQDYYSISGVSVKRYSVSAKIKRMVDNAEWSLTVVYGPQSENEKVSFMQEIRKIK